MEKRDYREVLLEILLTYGREFTIVNRDEWLSVKYGASTISDLKKMNLMHHTTANERSKHNPWDVTYTISEAGLKFLQENGYDNPRVDTEVDDPVRD